MTPVTKASFYPLDDKFPIYLETPTDWLKMSVNEAHQLIGELLSAIEIAEKNERKAA